MTIKKDMTQFAVIGLGRFGLALAKALYEEGMEVLAVDQNQDRIDDIADNCTHAAVADASEEEALRALGVSNLDAVVVCMGNNIQASVLCTLACKELQVPLIVCKATSIQHKKILEKIGADFVVIPEDDMAKKLALKLTNPNMNDIIELSKNFSLAEIEVPERWSDRTLLELNLRRKYGIIVLLVKSGDKIVTSPGGDCKLMAGNSVVVCGESDDIKKLAERLV